MAFGGPRGTLSSWGQRTPLWKNLILEKHPLILTPKILLTIYSNFIHKVNSQCYIQSQIVISNYYFQQQKLISNADSIRNQFILTIDTKEFKFNWQFTRKNKFGITVHKNSVSNYNFQYLIPIDHPQKKSIWNAKNSIPNYNFRQRIQFQLTFQL